MKNNLRLIILITFTLCSNAFAESIPFYHQGTLFKLINPSHDSQKKPLLLLLHGCKQSADIILQGTGLDQEALKRKFFLLVPEQSISMNSDHCWNWFYAFQQQRALFTEMSTMVSAIETVAMTYPIDHSRIFVAGISAGAAMAHNFLACYPDYFSGVAVHSGLAFKTAEDVFEAQSVLTTTTQKSPEYLGTKAYQCGRTVNNPPVIKKVMIIHGLDDKRVPSLHANLVSDTNQVISDLMDDKMLNHSDRPLVNQQVVTFPNGYTGFITDKNYKAFSERKILIKGMQHAWGGGQPISPNFDPKAPSSNSFILNFFNL